MNDNNVSVSDDESVASPGSRRGGGEWTRRLVMRLGSTLVALAVTALGHTGGPGTAAADSLGGELRYTCVLPPWPGQPMTVRLTWNAPSSMVVDQLTPAFSVDAVATVGPNVTMALAAVRAATVEGTVHAPGVVHAPEGNIDVALPLTVARTDAPPSGPMTIRATGTASRHEFRQPGPASITAGDTMTMRLVPKDADGDPTVGEVTLTCTLDPGQDTVVFSFVITPGSPTAGTPPTPGTPGRTASPTAGGDPAQPGTVATTPPGTVGPSPAPAATTPSTSAPPTAGDMSAQIANTASTALAQGRWWLIGAGILAVVAAALAGLWWWRQRQRGT
ncbi:DUF6801 domain-containing protein [Actinophytocola xinjiangensis]|uniref:DUF6801 domain-containing protein n=1 Tax=Actinophytocola xinjiangensis TaxID=485602 RepID=UPI000A5FDC37|nr:DUF6801 domain-containing protein [Actinophytocola xinjiangensis]